MAENQAKKEQKKKKALLRQDKAERAEMRRKNSDKGKSLEEMYMYVDEMGNLSSVPLNRSTIKPTKLEEIVFQTVPKSELAGDSELAREGQIQYFDQAKGFGFITDALTGQRIFVHSSELPRPVKEQERVSFLRGQNERGFFATNVTILAATK
ncbi:MAG: hypothetical protein BGO21_31830 [Dyadobacter sp. 50-39]|uniref:cold shock domain-containing protein n=1 Tax=Dyadobacter sp. 50-39 TaxID=1895756 RepID=UPI000968377D|nr:cold shock domain-containing protein [Dyadobacter sp. 50-39]OJV15572.1 MAG: hypothetical protein BGO21_31830 [Dyadobacter sp. 50-39]